MTDPKPGLWIPESVRRQMEQPSPVGPVTVDYTEHIEALAAVGSMMIEIAPDQWAPHELAEAREGQRLGELLADGSIKVVGTVTKMRTPPVS